jgi:hypothetical protein
MYEMQSADNPSGDHAKEYSWGKGNIERDAPEMRLNSLSETGVFPFGPAQMVGNRLTVFLTYQFRGLFVCVTFYAKWEAIFRSFQHVCYLFNDCVKYVGLQCKLRREYGRLIMKITAVSNRGLF